MKCLLAGTNRRKIVLQIEEDYASASKITIVWGKVEEPFDMEELSNLINVKKVVFVQSDMSDMDFLPDISYRLWLYGRITGTAQHKKYNVHEVMVHHGLPDAPEFHNVLTSVASVIPNVWNINIYAALDIEVEETQDPYVVERFGELFDWVPLYKELKSIKVFIPGQETTLYKSEIVKQLRKVKKKYGVQGLLCTFKPF